jgi:hypothetical protein
MRIFAIGKACLRHEWTVIRTIRIKKNAALDKTFHQDFT